MLKILFLEDSQFDAELIQHFLKRSGLSFSIKLVDSREKFILELKNFQPDIVLSDHSLPGFGSREALSILKASNNKGIPFILVTGTVSEEYAVEILKEGADDYIIKNNLNRLPNSISKAIREKKNEHEKEKLFENLKLLFTNIGEVFFSENWEEEKLIQISDACLSVFGFPREKFLEDFNFRNKIIHEDDRSIIAIQDSKLRCGESVYLEYRIRRGDDQIGWIGNKMIPTLDHNSRLTRVDGIVSDITTRKLAEAKLAAKNIELNNLIYRLTHDLKGPIASVEGLVNVSEYEIKEPSALKYLGMIRESNSKLNGILSSMIQLVRSDSGDMNKVGIDFLKIVEDVKSAHQNLLAVKSIRFEVNINLKKTFFSNYESIYSILYNLITNSIHYSISGDPFINISVINLKKRIQIKVSDNGIGIPSKFYDKIFDIFFRANEDSKGSGLGLYIVKKMVENLQGSINLESQFPGGTVFTIDLPCEELR